MPSETFTIGVEEEFLVVDAATGALQPDSPALLHLIVGETRPAAC